MTELRIPRSVGGTVDDVPNQDFIQPQTEQDSNSLVIPRSVGGNVDVEESSNQQQLQGDNTPINVAAEFASAFNRGLINVADFFTTDQINAIMRLAGSDKRVPSIESTKLGQAVAGGGFMRDGTAKNIVSTAGEFVGPGVATGALLRGATRGIQETQKVLPNVMKQFGVGNVADDALISAAAGAGGQTGKESGIPGAELAGSVVVGAVAPATLSKVGNYATAISRKLGITKQSADELASAMSKQVDEATDEIILDTLQREGITPEQAAKRFSKLGDDAIPADIGESFAGRLRAVANRLPNVRGQANRTLGQRKEGEAARISKALDDNTGNTGFDVDGAIGSLQKRLKPEIDKAYKAARDAIYNFSPRMQKILAGNNSLSRAAKKAELRLADKKAVGDPVFNMDRVDAIKQELDDQIGKALRKGEKNKARDLIRLKNTMVKEADKTVPEYKKARDLFAGRVALETAAENGELFFKMPSSQMLRYSATLSQSERKFYLMGAKKAIQEKIESSNVNSDLVKRLFGKNGDVKKLQSLFETPRQYNSFVKQLRREVRFNITRNEVRGNSTTVRQAIDDSSLDNAIEHVKSLAIATSSPIGAATQLQSMLRRVTQARTDEVSTESLQRVGQFLLDTGSGPKEVERLLSKASEKVLTRALLRAAEKASVTGAQKRFTQSGRSIVANEVVNR